MNHRIACIILLLLSLTTPVMLHGQKSLRVHLGNQVSTDTVSADSARVLQATRRDQVVAITPTAEGSFEIIQKVRDASIWLAPSVGVDFFVRESGTGNYRAGIIPGVGYGFKWGDASDRDNLRPYAALDFFLQGALTDELSDHSGFDYFNIDVLPVFTIYNWVSVGYGWRFKIGLEGVEGVNRNIFSFGLRKGT